MMFFVQKRSIDIININDLQPRSFIYCICNDTDEMQTDLYFNNLSL